MSIQFKLTINWEGAAFDPDWRPELAELVAQLGRDLGEGRDCNRIIQDVNGNTVGECSIAEELDGAAHVSPNDPIFECARPGCNGRAGRPGGFCSSICSHKITGEGPHDRHRNAPRDSGGKTIDLVATNHGSLFVLEPHTQPAREWCDENLGDDETQHWGLDGIVVEPRYLEDILQGARERGLHAVIL
jgi:hypothetical protein